MLRPRRDELEPINRTPYAFLTTVQHMAVNHRGFHALVAEQPHRSVHDVELSRGD